MEPNTNQYSPANAFNIPGLAMALPLIVLLTGCLSYLYTVITIFFPFIYLNVIITLGYGMGLGYLLLIVLRLTGIRDRAGRIGLTVFAGISAIVFAWIAFLLYVLLEGNYPSFNQYLLFIPDGLNPGLAFSLIGIINETGLWSVFGIDLRGFALTLVWLAEFAMIVGFPLLVVLRATPMPYSEALRKWYPKYTLEQKFQSVFNAGPVVQQLQKDVSGTLENLKGDSAYRYANAHIFFLPGETEQYLSLENVILQRGNNGGTKKETVLPGFRIDTATAKMLMDSYPHKRNRLEIF